MSLPHRITHIILVKEQDCVTHVEAEVHGGLLGHQDGIAIKIEGLL